MRTAGLAASVTLSILGVASAATHVAAHGALRVGGSGELSRVGGSGDLSASSRSYHAFVVSPEAYGGALSTVAFNALASRTRSSHGRQRVQLALRAKTVEAVNLLKERTTHSLEALGRGWTPAETPPILVHLQRSGSGGRVFA